LKRSHKRRDLIWNLLTIFTLLMVMIACSLFVLVYQSPTSAMNPFPPPTMPVAMILPTSTATPIKLPPTWTPEPTSTATITSTPEASLTPQATSTATPVPTAQPTEEIELDASEYAYTIQGDPAAVAASLFNSARQECNWMGVAGQAHDLQGRPITGIIVQLGGTLEGQEVNQLSMTGTALNYGPAGYEFSLSDHPAASQDTLWVRLLDQSSIPLSRKVYFHTSDSSICDQNLVIINFKEIR
jgi:hypothetical protein